MVRVHSVLALLVALFSAQVATAADQYVFADIPWGATKDQISDKMSQAAGGVFEFKEVLPTGDIGYITKEGKTFLKQQATVLFCMDAKGGLQKVIVILITDEPEALNTYASVRRDLTRKYGDPPIDVAEFYEPYQAGDGNEAQAIKDGKAKILTIWPVKEGGYLMLLVHKVLVVHIHYAGPGWQAEYDRRQSAEVDAL